MSSFVRSVEKRLMKRAGYTREKWIIVKNSRGDPEPREVRRGGEITDPDDTPIGRHWPARIPTRVKAPARKQKRAFPGAYNRGRKARGIRRGTPNKRVAYGGGEAEGRMSDDQQKIIPFKPRERVPLIHRKWEELRKTYQGPAQYPEHILGLDGDD